MLDHPYQAEGHEWGEKSGDGGRSRSESCVDVITQISTDQPVTDPDQYQISECFEEPMISASSDSCFSRVGPWC